MIELREWQDVMFEAGVPEVMLEFVRIDLNDTYLSNKAICLLNNLLSKTSEDNQKKMMNILKKNNLFFSVFYYVKTRL
jgi:hypothetical protein